MSSSGRRSRNGWTCIGNEAEDGVEALHAIETHAPDILFPEIQMPVYRASKSCAKWVRDAVTAYGKESVTAFDRSPCDDVLKPFSPARLGGHWQELNTAG